MGKKTSEKRGKLFGVLNILDLIILLFLLSLGAALAFRGNVKDQLGSTADDVTVEFSVRIEPVRVMTYMAVEEGDPLFDNETGKAFADLITLHDEAVDESQPLELFDPDATWKRKVFTDIEAKELLVPIFQGGQLVYQVPDLQASRAYCTRQIDSLWDEVKRFENPHNYYVDLSQRLWDIKQSLLNSHTLG